VTDDVNCLVIIIAKDDNNIASVEFEIKRFISILPLVYTAYRYDLYRQALCGRIARTLSALVIVQVEVVLCKLAF